MRFFDPAGAEETFESSADVLFSEVSFLSESLDGGESPGRLVISAVDEDVEEFLLAVGGGEVFVDRFGGLCSGRHTVYSYTRASIKGYDN